MAISLMVSAGISAAFALFQWLDVEAALSPWVAQARPGMAYGNLRQPNQLASLLALGIWSSLWIWQEISAVERRPFLRLGMFAYLTLVTFALVASASRVGLLHVLMICGTCAIWRLSHRNALHEKSWLIWSSATLALMAAWTVLTPTLTELNGSHHHRELLGRIASAESTCGSRRILWTNVLHLISLRPWLGWGWGNLDWAHYITLYPGERFCHILDNAHNLPLHLAVELGVPIAVVIVFGLLMLTIRSMPWKEELPHRQLAWGLLLVIMTHSMVEYPLWYGGFQITALAALAVLIFDRLPFPSARVIAPLAFTFLLTLTYAAWDYWRISQIFLPVDKRAAAFANQALRHAQQSWLFKSTVEFAELSVTPVNIRNALAMQSLALRVLHYSPEPNVVEKLIESSKLLSDSELEQAHRLRFMRAYPSEYTQYLQESASKNHDKQ